MINNHQIVDIIERANDAQPICPCGRHTTPVYRDGAVWLECSSLTKPRESLVHRAIASVTSFAHTHAHIVDVPAESDAAA